MSASEREAAREDRIYFDDVSGEFVVSGTAERRILSAGETDEEGWALCEVAVDANTPEPDE